MIFDRWILELLQKHSSSHQKHQHQHHQHQKHRQKQHLTGLKRDTPYKIDFKFQNILPHVPCEGKLIEKPLEKKLVEEQSVRTHSTGSGHEGTVKVRENMTAVANLY